MRLRVQERVWGNEYRTVLVCVDDFEDRILSGWICHPCLGEGRKVRGLMEFFKVVEDLLEQIRFPQSFTAKRAFGQAEPVFCREERDSAQGPHAKGNWERLQCGFCFGTMPAGRGLCRGWRADRKSRSEVHWS